MKPHPARFPRRLPEFFIRFLTNPGDVVVDPFAGSNVTGEAAEMLNRRWLAIEHDPEYVKASRFRFEKPVERDLGFGSQEVPGKLGTGETGGCRNESCRSLRDASGSSNDWLRRQRTHGAV